MRSRSPGRGDGGRGHPERRALAEERLRFWAEFLTCLKLDDPEQPKPRPARSEWFGFSLPAPGGSSWLTVYRNMRRDEVGVFLSSWRNTAGEYATQAIVDDWVTVKDHLAETPDWSEGWPASHHQFAHGQAAESGGGAEKSVRVAGRAGEYLRKRDAPSRAVGGGRLPIARRVAALVDSYLDRIIPCFDPSPKREGRAALRIGS